MSTYFTYINKHNFIEFYIENHMLDIMEYILYKKVKLLFLDDDIDSQNALEKILKPAKNKYDYTIADSLQVAQEVIKNGSIDVVISSYFIGDTSIIELIPLLSEIPLIVISESKNIDYLLNAINAGAYDYVIKDSGYNYLKALLITIAKVITIKKVKEIAVKSCLDEIQYRNIVQNIPDIIYRIDPEGYFTFVNRAIQVMGYKPEELIGKHFKHIIHPEDFSFICREEYLIGYEKEKVFEEKSPRFFNERRRGPRRTMGLEVRLICKSWKQNSGDSDIIIGSVISFGEISAQGEYRGKENKFIGTVGIIHDITNRKKAEALLRKLYEAVDQSPISTIIVNSKCIIEYVNPLFLRKSGYSPPELLGQHIVVLNAMQHSKSNLLDFTTIIGSTKKWSGEMISVKKSGERYWESVIITPIIDPKGYVTNYLIIKMDITKQKMVQSTLQKAYKELDIKVAERTKELSETNKQLLKEIEERKLMEEALKKSEEKFRDFMETASDLMHITDKDGCFSYVNESTSRTLGYTKEEMIGMSFKNILSPDLLGNHYDATLDELMKNGKVSGETKLKTKEGKEIYGEISVVVISDENGNFAGSRAVFRDMTERKQIEQEKAELELQLMQAKKFETLGTLAGGIAHDFNNLLTPILGFTEMVQDDLPKESSSYNKLTNVITTVYRAKNLVRQILTFSRRIEQNPETVKIQQIIKEVIQLLKVSIPDTIKVHKEIDPSCSSILIDPTQIHQVIFNLCNNACLAMNESGGELTLKLSETDLDEEFVKKYQNLKQGKYIKLEIADTGHGMDKKTLDHIFEPFFTTRKVGEGTGLGLSVVHGIVQSNHGEILVHSEPGKGTHFCIYFPVKEILIQEESVPKKIQKGNEHILFVDDEISIVGVIRELLERLGYTVTVANNGKQALGIFREKSHDFDLVITDQIMPDMLGEQLTREITRIRPQIPVILLTGFIGELSQERLKKFGIHKCILKPIDMYTLSKTMREVLDNK